MSEVAPDQNGDNGKNETSENKSTSIENIPSEGTGMYRTTC